MGRCPDRQARRADQRRRVRRQNALTAEIPKKGAQRRQLPRHAGAGQLLPVQPGHEAADGELIDRGGTGGVMIGRPLAEIRQELREVHPVVPQGMDGRIPLPFEVSQVRLDGRLHGSLTARNAKPPLHPTAARRHIQPREIYAGAPERSSEKGSVSPARPRPACRLVMHSRRIPAARSALRSPKGCRGRYRSEIWFCYESLQYSFFFRK